MSLNADNNYCLRIASRQQREHLISRFLYILVQLASPFLTLSLDADNNYRLRIASTQQSKHHILRSLYISVTLSSHLRTLSPPETGLSFEQSSLPFHNRSCE